MLLCDWDLSRRYWRNYMTVVRDLRAWLPGVEGVLLCEFHLQWYWSVLLGGLTFGVDPDSVGSGQANVDVPLGRQGRPIW
jgi:hypothetical protein